MSLAEASSAQTAASDALIRANQAERGMPRSQNAIHRSSRGREETAELGNDWDIIYLTWEFPSGNTP